MSLTPLFDLHTHTIASGHAYSTLLENITAAKEHGLIAIGTSDHSPGMPFGTNEIFFENYRVFPEEINGIRLLKGIEVNIIDFDGGVDGGQVMPEMDYVIASIHSHCIKSGTIEENTRAVIGAMKNPWVKIIGHLDDGRYPLNYDKIVVAALEYKVALEINDSSLRPSSARLNGPQQVAVLAEKAVQSKVPVVMGSDAHMWCHVGRLDAAQKVLQNVNYPESLVLNYSLNGLEWLLRKQKY